MVSLEQSFVCFFQSYIYIHIYMNIHMHIYIHIYLFIPGIKVKLQIWDTAGQERFRSITQSYYRSAHSLILVYDISSQPSFDSLPQWCRDMDQYAGAGGEFPFDISIHRFPFEGNGSKGIVKVLVGNKCDKDREVPEHIAEQFAEHNNFNLFMETSAFKRKMLKGCFMRLPKHLLSEVLRIKTVHQTLQRIEGWRKIHLLDSIAALACPVNFHDQFFSIHSLFTWKSNLTWNIVWNDIVYGNNSSQEVTIPKMEETDGRIRERK